MVQLTKVESSNLDAIGYDDDQNELYVRFVGNSRRFIYEGVPKGVFTELIECNETGGSVGTLFIKKVKRVYKDFRVEV